jgi:putative spermidine/putrescine transport system substrate-binding protein
MLLAACGGGGAATCDPITSADTIPLEELERCATAEGTISTIALPRDWANYGEIIDTFSERYGLEYNGLDPNAGSSEELEAIRANRDNPGPQAPDVVDIGVGHTVTAMADGLIAPYKVATWDSIPMKDPDGYWWAEYYGVLTFEGNNDIITTMPEDWEDLIDPMYRGMVAMAGDVLQSNESVMTVLAAGLSRTGGNFEGAAEAGLQFWAEVNQAGNFIPVISDVGKIAQGETPLTIQWDYLSLANRDTLAGNPELSIVVPRTGVVAGPYAGAISAFAPHPYAARLWWEFVMSDEGQLMYLKGYAHPIRFNDMAARGVIPQELADRLPPAEAYEQAIFLTTDQLTEAKTIITEGWRRVVFGE